MVKNTYHGAEFGAEFGGENYGEKRREWKQEFSEFVGKENEESNQLKRERNQNGNGRN